MNASTQTIPSYQIHCRMSQEAAALVICEGLHDLSAGAHDKRAMRHNRLLQRCACEHDEAKAPALVGLKRHIAGGAKATDFALLNDSIAGAEAA